MTDTKEVHPGQGLSSPIESLLTNKDSGASVLDADYLIIGSGYGGSVAAARLAGEGRDVVLIERGREYAAGDFPYDIGDIPSHVRLLGDEDGGGYADALFNIHSHEDLDVLVGSGLGGTSLINANVAEEAPAHVFRKADWPKHFRTMAAPLKAEYADVKKVLGVTPHPSLVTGKPLSKYTELARLGRALGAPAQPAEIAVTFNSKQAAVTNAVGLEQNPCTDCGNCVTGCNVGAKNTLDRNLLPLARSRGARLYTGASVRRIVEASAGASHRWRVEFAATAQPKGSVRADTYWIEARHVILAAGTLGSTEILLRSETDGLPFSNELGKRFATNGDGVIASFGQEFEVNAIASAEQKSPDAENKVGPTITGVMRPQFKGLGQITIEEASIPAAVARVFSEMIATGALFQRLADGRRPKFFKETGRDPLAGARDTARHSQTFLVMGDDGAEGELSLDRSKSKTGALKIHYPEVGKNPALAQANATVSSQDRKAGLGFGQYVPNPLRELIPPAASSAMGGAMPEPRVMTVHPIGGCAMGDSVAKGVVNAFGQVFKPGGGSEEVYEGLYVFDGAMLPTALETNPFLTIAALAWHHCSELLKREGLSASNVDLADQQLLPMHDVPERRRDHPATRFTIQEQLTGALESLPPTLAKHLAKNEAQRQRLLETEGLVVEVVAEISDGDAWLDGPGEQPLDATMKLYVNPLSACEVNTFNPVGVRRDHLEKAEALELTGHFTVFLEDKLDMWTRVKRTGKALWAYVRRRGIRTLNLFGNDNGNSGWLAKLLGLFRGIRVLVNIADMQGHYRRMVYDFTSETHGLKVYGEKVLGYSMDLKPLWPALLNLPLEFREANGQIARGQLSVNSEQLLDPGLLRAEGAPDLPRNLMFTAGIGGFFVRSLITTQFWEFGGADYPPRNRQVRLPQALKYDAKEIEPESAYIHAPLCDGRTETTPLLMTRYRQPENKQAPPMLLIHGLAQGSQIYWLDTIENLASFMHREGYDVWMVDYRLSNLFMGCHAHEDWSMDDIAKFDIPAALNHVFDETQQKVNVFAHCVGACSLAMAALKGWLDSSRINALVSNAIHPWVITSTGNRFRAKFGEFNREWLTTDLLNPIPHDEENAAANVLDRVAFSVARIAEREQDHHRDFGADPYGDAICNRMTLLYGRMWNHKKLNRETHDLFKEMFGPAPGSVYQHLYYYSTQRRITDKDGNNEYLKDNNIRANWTFPTLFVHGADSEVFNPHSARRSAIRLNKIIRGKNGAMKIPISYKIFEGYGHMDVIFGEPAHKKPFHRYLKFFQQPHKSHDPIDDPDWPTPRPHWPRTGPLLRAAWKEEGRIHLRYTAELRDRLATPATRLRVMGAGVKEENAGAIEAPDAYSTDRQRHYFVDASIDANHPSLTLDIAGERSEKSPPVDGLTVKLKNAAWLHRLRNEDPNTKKMRFLVGSCRFPGSIIDNEQTDAIFKRMSKLTKGKEGAQLLFLIGDQIYADATDQIMETKSPNARYTERYRRAFRRRRSPEFAKLVARIPTHFALDDHEIDDNWSGLHIPRGAPSKAEQQQIDDKAEELRFAVNDATRFQGSLRNQVPISTKGLTNPFYYPLEAPAESAFPMFLLDTRTERTFRDSNNPKSGSLISAPQFTYLQNWLSHAKEVFPNDPKFIVSGSTIAPFGDRYLADGSNWRTLDGWAGYPATLEGLLKLIADEEIKNVVFVGGDAHLSAVSKLEIETRGGGATAWQIVGSGLYAPLPFANSREEDFTWNERLCVPTHTKELTSLHTTNVLLSDGYSQFLDVHVDQAKIKVRCVNEKGGESKCYKIPLASES